MAVGRELWMGEGLGVLNEVSGFLDETLDGVGGFAEAGVETVPVQDVPSRGVLSD